VVAVVPPYKVCSTAKAHLKIYTVETNVWPPVSGETLLVNMTGEIDETVTAGTYTIDVTLDGIPLPSIGGDIDQFKPLPLPDGNLSMSFSQDIPSGILQGTTCSLQISAVDQNNDQLFCITMSFTFGEMMENEQPIRISRPSMHFPVKKIPKPITTNVVSRLAEKQQEEHRHH